MPAIYVVAALAALLLLIGAYRSMGRSATAVQDPRAVLAEVLRIAADGADSLEAASGRDDQAELARDVRRRLDGCAQAIERLDPPAMSTPIAAAREALTQAVAELGWAARLAEGAGFAGDEELQRAATGLRTAASGRVEVARGALAVSAS